MLLTFSVTNYKSIKQTQTLSMVAGALRGPHAPIDATFPGGDYGILPSAIIYGANASGKSNVLDALVSMRSIVSSSQSPVRHRPFLLDEQSNELPTTFEAVFLVNSVRYDFGFSFTEDNIHHEYLYSYPEGRRRKLYDRRDLNIEFGPALKGPKKALAGFLREDALFLSIAAENKHEELLAISSFFSSIYAYNKISVATGLLNAVFKENEIDKRTIYFMNAIGTGVTSYKQEPVEISDDMIGFMKDLHEVVSRHRGEEDNIEGFDPGDHVEIKLGHKSFNGDTRYFGSDQESAGTRRILLLLNGLLDCLDHGKIALVDELDASLHSIAVAAVISLFLDKGINKYGAQIIATTHDTNLLNPKNLRRDEIWFSEKNISGDSEYFSLAEVKSRRGESFEKAYLQGRYGAIPSKFPPELLLEDPIVDSISEPKADA